MKIITLLLVIALSLFSQVSNQPAQFTNTKQVPRQAIPTSNTCLIGAASTCGTVISATPYLCGVDLVGTGQTITIQDVGSLPWIVAGGTLGTMGNPVGWTWSNPQHDDSGCVPFAGGIYIIAGSSGATMHLLVKY